jgi:hypothetical protein
MQTLTNLLTGWNKIGNEGVRYLANALHKNEVGWFAFYLTHTYVYYSLQTLTILSLENNEISVEGALHLINALQQNTVRSVSFFTS